MVIQQRKGVNHRNADELSRKKPRKCKREDCEDCSLEQRDCICAVTTRSKLRNAVTNQKLRGSATDEEDLHEASKVHIEGGIVEMTSTSDEDHQPDDMPILEKMEKLVEDRSSTTGFEDQFDTMPTLEKMEDRPIADGTSITSINDQMADRIQGNSTGNHQIADDVVGLRIDDKELTTVKPISEQMEYCLTANSAPSTSMTDKMADHIQQNITGNHQNC